MAKSKQETNKLGVTPLHDWFIIKPDAEETITKGGIHIPDTAREKPRKGEVMAIGTGMKNEDSGLVIGDRVIFEKSGASEMEIEGETYLKMKYGSISFKL